MKVLTLLQEGLFPVVPMLMDEIETDQFNFMMSFNSLCNELGKNMLGIQGAEVFFLLFDAWLEVSEEKKRLYKQKALLRQLHHTLLLLSSYATGLQGGTYGIKNEIHGSKCGGEHLYHASFSMKANSKQEKLSLAGLSATV